MLIYIKYGSDGKPVMWYLKRYTDGPYVAQATSCEAIEAAHRLLK